MLLKEKDTSYNNRHNKLGDTLKDINLVVVYAYVINCKHMYLVKLNKIVIS